MADTPAPTDNSSIVNMMIAGMESTDSKLRDVIQRLSNDLYGLVNNLNPPQSKNPTLLDGGTPGIVSDPGAFTATVFNNDIRLNWNPGAVGIYLYEIRLGPVFVTANILLTTATYSADIDPVSRFILTGNTYIFWLTALDDQGDTSNTLSVSVAIPNIGAPVINPTVLQNYVLLFWTIPTSTFVIDHYIVYRNGVFYGNAGGTFQSIFEVASGMYSYQVQAVDIVGNLGGLSPIVTITLNTPADYINYGTKLSTFTGTKVNCALATDPTKLLATLNATETWAQHYTNNSWTTIAQQVAAGYPLYCEPSQSTGSYTEVFDFTGIVVNAIIVINYNTTVIAGSVAVTFTIAASNDNITYDTPQAGTSRFCTSLRYAKVVVTFTPSPTDKSLIYFYNFNAVLSVHQETDAGTASVVSTDSGGTVVSLNKPFKSLVSITLTPQGTTDMRAVFNYAFATTNPTSFQILLFNTSGTRLSGTVGWMVKGVI